jgi:hypothetical protein
MKAAAGRRRLRRHKPLSAPQKKVDDARGFPHLQCVSESSFYLRFVFATMR